MDRARYISRKGAETQRIEPNILCTTAKFATAQRIEQGKSCAELQAF
jgi:hypothetical protein